MKRAKIFISIFLSIALIFTLLPCNGNYAKAATKPKLVKKSVTMKVGKKTKIKIRNLDKNAKVTYKSSKKAIAQVNKNGKVKAKKVGKATIKIRILQSNNKKYVLKFKVSVKRKPSQKNVRITVKPTISPIIEPTEVPTTSPTIEPTIVPTVSPTTDVTTEPTASPATEPTTEPTATATISPSSTISYPTTNVYKVTFVSNGGNDIDSQNILAGSTAKIPDSPIRPGYTFNGWYTDAEFKNEYDFNAPIKNNLTLYANWLANAVAKSFTLSANKDKMLLEDTKNEALLLYLETDLDVNKIDLYDNRNMSQPITSMYDDGSFSAHGDDMAGDGIYTAKLDNAVSLETTLSFIAKYGKNQSNKIDVEFFAPLTDETLTSIATADKKIDNLLESSEYKNMNSEDKTLKVEELLEELKSENLIVQNSVYYDTDLNLFSFEYADGIMGGIKPEEFNSDLNGTDDNISAKIAPLQEEPSDIISNPKTDIGKALILNAFPEFETTQDKIAFRSEFYETLAENWNENGLQSTLDVDVSIEDFKKWVNYNIVCVSTHGSIYPWIDEGYHEKPAICLPEKSTKDKDQLYTIELKDKQIVKVNGDYWILPAFFQAQYKTNDLNKTFVFSESCQFMGRDDNWDYSMSNAILSHSARAVVGYHNSVYAVYSREFMKNYVSELINGQTARKAFDTASANVGENHAVWFENTHGKETYDKTIPIAYPYLSGEDTATLINTGLQNGDFELFDSSAANSVPAYWNCNGDVRSLAQLGDVTPYGDSSTRMAIITTGVGSKTTATIGDGTEGSQISQKFVVPDNASTISFDYNFISEEPMEYVESIFDDSFAVEIIKNGNTEVQQTFESINTSTWTNVNGIDFDGGDETVYQTGWKNAKLDVTAYRGEIITLSFLIYDMGDSIYDSACVLDNIIVK